MLVTSMTIDDYNSHEPLGQIHVADPTWEDIKNGIESLDNDQRSTLKLHTSKQNYMIIGGGNGWYVCQAFTVNHNFRYLNPDISPESFDERELVVGQPTDVFEIECLPLDYVLKAAKYYAETGEMDDTLLWDQYD